MITPKDAFRLLHDLPVPSGTQKIALEDSIGRILAVDICADRDFPPFDRVMMDGIAVQDILVREWPLAGIAYAGEKEFIFRDGSAAVEIMTGAILPSQAQAVIKIEELEFFQQDQKPWVRYIGPPQSKGDNSYISEESMRWQVKSWWKKVKKWGLLR